MLRAVRQEAHEKPTNAAGPPGFTVYVFLYLTKKSGCPSIILSIIFLDIYQMRHFFGVFLKKERKKESGCPLAQRPQNSSN